MPRLGRTRKSAGRKKVRFDLPAMTHRQMRQQEIKKCREELQEVALQLERAKLAVQHYDRVRAMVTERDRRVSAAVGHRHFSDASQYAGVERELFPNGLRYPKLRQCKRLTTAPKAASPGGNNLTELQEKLVDLQLEMQAYYLNNMQKITHVEETEGFKVLDG